VELSKAIGKLSNAFFNKTWNSGTPRSHTVLERTQVLKKAAMAAIRIEEQQLSRETPQRMRWFTATLAGESKTRRKCEPLSEIVSNGQKHSRNRTDVQQSEIQQLTCQSRREKLRSQRKNGRIADCFTFTSSLSKRCFQIAFLIEVLSLAADDMVLKRCTGG
jgi:hypothetical protein